MKKKQTNYGWTDDQRKLLKAKELVGFMHYFENVETGLEKREALDLKDEIDKIEAIALNPKNLLCFAFLGPYNTDKFEVFEDYESNLCRQRDLFIERLKGLKSYI